MDLRLLLAGGGGAEDSRPLDALFAAWTGRGGRMLYVPVAMDERVRSYDSSYAWISSVFEPLGVGEIELWTELPRGNDSGLARFDSVYIGGGNTYRLLHAMRSSGFAEVLARFADRGGAVYGGSAGAAVLGRDISTVASMDANEVGLTDTRGLDLVGGYSAWCHYEPGHDPEIRCYVAGRGEPVLALPERAGVCVSGEGIRAVGYEPVAVFRPGEDGAEIIPPGARVGGG